MSKLRRSVRQVFITEKGKSYKMSVEQKETCRLERVWVKCLEVARGISWCNDIEKLHQCRDNLVEAEQRFSEFYKSCRETTTDLDLECMLEEHSELMSKLDERLEVMSDGGVVAVLNLGNQTYSTYNMATIQEEARLSEIELAYIKEQGKLESEVTRLEVQLKELAAKKR